MMLGARTGAWAKSGGWVNPYVTEGLVAMWDGEWNAGGGVHSEVKRCIDITGLNGEVENYYSQESDSFWLRNSNSPVEIGDDLLAAIASGTFTFESFIDIQYIGSWNYLVGAKYSSDWLKFSIRFNDSSSVLASNKVMNSGFNDIKIGVNRISFTSLTNGNGVIFGNEKSKSFSGMIATEPITDRSLYFGLLKNYGYSCDCKVHCVRFYNRRLSDDEIASNYAIDKARFNLP